MNCDNSIGNDGRTIVSPSNFPPKTKRINDSPSDLVNETKTFQMKYIEDIFERQQHERENKNQLTQHEFDRVGEHSTNNDFQDLC